MLAAWACRCTGSITGCEWEATARDERFLLSPDLERDFGSASSMETDNGVLFTPESETVACKPRFERGIVAVDDADAAVLGVIVGLGAGEDERELLARPSEGRVSDDLMTTMVIPKLAGESGRGWSGLVGYLDVGSLI